MTNLKDQIEQKIRTERERAEESVQARHRDEDEASERLNAIRPRLDELSHVSDNYSVKVAYAKGPYAAAIAVVELNATGGTWVATWQVAATVSGSLPDWEVTYNPHGVETQHEWFRNSDDLFDYLTASIAARIVEMEADQD